MLLRTGGQFGQVVPALIDMLHDNDEQLCETAAEALGGIGPDAETALPALTQAVQDKWPAVRDAASTALKRVAPRHTVNAGSN